ncbi:MAG: glycosyltransferase family 2 protein, partial [Marinirhabdus sp.]
MPKIAIVISVYNKERFLRATLQGIFAQTFQDFEVICIDDGSTDGSAKIIKSIEDKRITYFFQQNQGASAARNAGIARASAPYIAFLDADDHWYPDHLEVLNGSITNFPQQSVFATAVEVTKNGRTSPRSYSIAKTHNPVVVDYFEASTRASVLHSSALLVKKGVFKTTGGYNTAYKSGEDTDLYVRIGLRYKVVFHPKITVCYLLRPDGLSGTSKTLRGKATFTEYAEAEGERANVKRFLDLNRFSIAV